MYLQFSLVSREEYVGSRGFNTSSNVQDLGKTQEGYLNRRTPNFLVYEIQTLDIQWTWIISPPHSGFMIHFTIWYRVDDP